MRNRAFKIRSRSNKKTRSVFIHIEGEAGINQIENIRKKIDFTISGTKEITIELQNIVSFDLSTFQMLFSLRKNMIESGRMVNINTILPQEDLAILNNCGLGDYIKNWNQN